MAVIVGVLCLMMIIWVLENQRTQKADDKNAMVLTFRGNAGCEIDKRKNGKINMGVNFTGSMLSKK